MSAKAGRAAPSDEATAGFVQRVLRVPCSEHGAVSGELCWSDATRGVCGERIARAGRLRIRDRHSKDRSPR